jgi:hypothetical protein
MEVAGMLASDPTEAADGAAIDLAEPAGLADAAPLGDMLQDRFDLLWWQSRIEEGRPFALGESGLASMAAEHASGLLGTIATGHCQVSSPTLAMFGAVGIQAAEAREVVHGAAPPMRSSRLMASCVTSA